MHSNEIAKNPRAKALAEAFASAYRSGFADNTARVWPGEQYAPGELRGDLPRIPLRGRLHGQIAAALSLTPEYLEEEIKATYMRGYRARQEKA